MVTVIIAVVYFMLLLHPTGATILTTLGIGLQVATFARQSQESVKSDWINPNEVMLWVFFNSHYAHLNIMVKSPSEHDIIIVFKDQHLDY